jgi:hypothetical protein
MSNQGDLTVVTEQECRGRQPFAGARGVLANLLLPAQGGKRAFLNSPDEQQVHFTGENQQA